MPTRNLGSLVVPLEEMQHSLSRTWSPVGHMNGVLNSDELRAAYNACLPLLTAWHTDLAQNEHLYRAYETIAAAASAQSARAARRKLLENALRDFRLAGVALPADRKQRFKALMEQLATLAVEVRRERARCDECVVASRYRRERNRGLPDADRSNAHGPPRKRATSRAGCSRSMRRTIRPS